jgi:hypothetical protein
MIQETHTDLLGRPLLQRSASLLFAARSSIDKLPAPADPK